MKGNKRAVINSRCDTYESVSDAARAVYVHPSAIVKAIQRGGKCVGMRWAYYDEPLPDSFAGEMVSCEDARKAKVLAQMQQDWGDRRHGTLYGYTLGCRCRKCKVARGMRDVVEVAR